MQAGVIADDLTGAQEIGVLLVARGLRTVVTVGPVETLPKADAVVIDTESRHLQPADAFQRVFSATAQLKTAGAERLFKKVDSTLRGNIAAELPAFSSDVIFTPAYPAMGRVVRGGMLYVNDVPVAQTEFARDARSPSASALAMLDAATDEDLVAIVRNCSESPCAGSGGLGRAWVASLPAGDFVPPPIRKPNRPLVVCGSRHPMSRSQAEAARLAGIPVLMSPDEPDSPAKVAQSLACETVQTDADLLILFGGDTSYAVLCEMGITELHPIRELMPGVALSTAREMMIVTKAGGFSGADIVARILDQLT